MRLRPQSITNLLFQPSADVLVAALQIRKPEIFGAKIITTYQGLVNSMDWFKGKLTGKPHI